MIVEEKKDLSRKACDSQRLAKVDGLELVTIKLMKISDKSVKKGVVAVIAVLKWIKQVVASVRCCV